MRIALLHPFSWPDVRRGGERYLHDLGWYLDGAGHDVEILTGRSRLWATTDVIDGVVVRRAWRRGRGDPWSPAAVARDCDEVARLLDDGGFDLAHALWPPAAVGAAAAGTPVLYTMLGLPNDWLEAQEQAWHAHREAFAAADVVAGLSRVAAGAIGARAGRDAIVLPPGIRTPAFPPRLDPRTGAPRLLFSGALDEPAKGLPWLLEAMPEVLEAVPGTRLRLSGPGDAAGLLEDASPAVRDRVDLLGTGTLEEVPRRYADATVTVLPSQGEAFGLAVLESLASGTPVVTTASFGPAEIVGDGVVGETVSFGDVSALAGAVLDVAERAGRAGVPRRCVQRAHEWDWETVVGPDHERVYRDLVVPAPGGAGT